MHATVRQAARVARLSAQSVRDTPAAHTQLRGQAWRRPFSTTVRSCEQAASPTTAGSPLATEPLRARPSRLAALARGVLKYGAIVGVAGYGGFVLARQLVHPLPIPAAADLPPEALSAHVAGVEKAINEHAFVRALRQRPELRESRPHTKLHPNDRPHNLTGGTLAGPGKITVAPYVWGSRDGAELYVVAHLGRDLCGHDGIVHGGLLATILDEALARCCFPALPNKIGVTANLNVNYRRPTRADQLVVVRCATTKVEGRKAWVEGSIATLPASGPGETLVEASALFIEPRYAKLMRRVVRQEYLE